MMVVEQKKIVNLSMPSRIADIYYALSEGVGGNSKWTVVSAAMLVFHTLSPEFQEEYISRVRGADHSDEMMEQLITDAQSGALADSVGIAVKKREKIRELKAKGNLTTVDRMNEKKAASTRSRPRGKSSTDDE